MRNFLRNILSHILRYEAKLVLLKYNPKIISVAGSLGKTSTKEAIFAVLSGFTHVRKSNKNYGNDIGIPLTILGCQVGEGNPYIWVKSILKGLWLILLKNKYPKWLILEVGARKPGEMELLSSWLKSDAVIFTSIGRISPHIEFFNSHKHLVEEKMKIVRTLKRDGFLILNNDDDVVANMKSETKSRVTTFGFREGSDLLCSNMNIFYNKDNIPDGMNFRVDVEGISLPISIGGVFGMNHVYSALAALSLVSVFKLDTILAVERLKNYHHSPSRMRLLRGIKESFIIDDSYNSSPLASISALETLRDIKINGRKIAVLGDMLELGKYTEEAHKELGKVACQNLTRKKDLLIVVGPRSKKIKEEACVSGMEEDRTLEFQNSKEAGEFLRAFVEPGDFVLVKGSQEMRMERVVEAILSEDENKNEVLIKR